MSEALELSWNRDDRPRVDLSGRYPMLLIPAEFDKGHQDRVLPMAPEFAEFLERTPEEQRTRRVFHEPSANGTPFHHKEAGRWISKIGKAAGVKVQEKTRADATVVKYASAHDLRRSFGERWATRIMPQQLMILMRHESIETTLRYYVGRNANTTAAVLWGAYSQNGTNNIRSNNCDSAILTSSSRVA